MTSKRILIEPMAESTYVSRDFLVASLSVVTHKTKSPRLDCADLEGRGRDTAR